MRLLWGLPAVNDRLLDVDVDDARHRARTTLNLSTTVLFRNNPWTSLFLPLKYLVRMYAGVLCNISIIHRTADVHRGRKPVISDGSLSFVRFG